MFIDHKYVPATKRKGPLAKVATWTIPKLGYDIAGQVKGIMAKFPPITSIVGEETRYPTTTETFGVAETDSAGREVAPLTIVRDLPPVTETVYNTTNTGTEYRKYLHRRAMSMGLPDKQFRSFEAQITGNLGATALEPYIASKLRNEAEQAAIRAAAGMPEAKILPIDVHIAQAGQHMIARRNAIANHEPIGFMHAPLGYHITQSLQPPHHEQIPPSQRAEVLRHILKLREKLPQQQRFAPEEYAEGLNINPALGIPKIMGPTYTATNQYIVPYNAGHDDPNHRASRNNFSGPSVDVFVSAMGLPAGTFKGTPTIPKYVEGSIPRVPHPEHDKRTGTHLYHQQRRSGKWKIDNAEPALLVNPPFNAKFTVDGKPISEQGDRIRNFKKKTAKKKK